MLANFTIDENGNEIPFKLEYHFTIKEPYPVELEKDPNIFLSFETSKYLASLCEIDFSGNFFNHPAYFSRAEKYHAFHVLKLNHINKTEEKLNKLEYVVK
jgi:hypothetical protein